MSSSDAFDDAKRAMLLSLQAGIDFSPKGSIDKPCLSCVDFINDQLADYVTTSSCSGRISVNRDEGTGKGVAWLLVEHGPVSACAVREAVQRQAPLPKGYGAELSDVIEYSPDAPAYPTAAASRCTTTTAAGSSIDQALSSFKCEGFILHIRCRDLAAGRRLHSVALAAGFRESGLTISAKRVMLAVRSTSFSLELPIARGTRLLLDEDLLALVVSEANNRLHDNFARISRFLYAMKSAFGYPTLSLSITPAPAADQSKQGQGRGRGPRRWGHCCVCMPGSQGGGLLCLGGQGTAEDSSAPVARREMPALLLESSVQNTTINVVQADSATAAAGATDCVHAASLPGLWTAARGVDLVVWSGGRRSPREALSPLRVLRWHSPAALALAPAPALLRGVSSELSEVELTSSGHVPPARWGHVFLPLDECTDSGVGVHTNSHTRVRQLFLHGGRDADSVFDDAYIATLYFMQNANQPEVCAVHCHWQLLPSTLSQLLGKRCFHAAAPLWSAVEGGEQSGSVLCATFALHGGLGDLGTRPAVEFADFWAVSLRVHIPARDVSLPLPESEGAESIVKQDLLCKTHAYLLCEQRVPRFGHRLTPVGAQTFLLSGGSMFNRITVADGAESDATLVYEINDDDEDVDQTTVTSVTDVQGNKDKIAASLAPLILVHCIQLPGGLAAQRRFALEISRAHSLLPLGDLSASSLRAEDTRCHHTASAAFNATSSGQMETTVSLVGGGVQVLAFGPSFCPSVKIRFSCKDQREEDAAEVPALAEQSAAAAQGYLPQQHVQQQPTGISQQHVVGAAALPLSGSLAVLVVPSSKAKRVKTFLEYHKWINKSRRLEPLTGSSVALAAEIYAGDISSSEEIESASSALAVSSAAYVNHAKQVQATVDNSIENAKFVQLSWLGLTAVQYAGLPTLSVDDVDPLAKKQTRREKDSTKHKPESGEVIAGEGAAQVKVNNKYANEGNSIEKSFMALPVESAFLRWLSSRSNGTAGSSETQTQIAGDFCQRLGCAFAPMFCLLPTTRVHTSTIPVKPEERACEILCKLVNDKEYAHHFPDPVAACSVAGLAIPRKWEIVGDVLMLPEGALTGHGWEHALVSPPAPSYSSEDVAAVTETNPVTQQAWEDAKQAEGIWQRVAACFGPHIRRVARRAKVDSGPRRESHILLLYPAVGRPPLPAPIDAAAPLHSMTQLQAHQFTSYASPKVTAPSLTTQYGETLLDVLPRSPGWVTVTENSIPFSFEMTRVMFCSGNVTERMRMAKQLCKDEIIVDLYAGVGYYTIPFLVHGGAKHVHALEWNPFSVVALKHNLARAGVSASRYTVHEGDNRITVLGESSQSPSFPSPFALTVAPPPPHIAHKDAPVSNMLPPDLAQKPSRNASLSGIANRVCCGLLPSSAEGWPLAAHVLNKTCGGIIHVHENIHEDLLQNWAHVQLCNAFELLFQALADSETGAASRMSVKCVHLEKVKSYAPRVVHVVADLQCVPVPISTAR